MSVSRLWVLGVLIVASGGCRDDVPPAADPEAEIRANLAQLGPEDQRLAEQQESCPLMPGVRLGQMGPPRKITVKGVSTFVCCEGCVRSAENNPDQALAKIRAMEQAQGKK